MNEAEERADETFTYLPDMTVEAKVREKQDRRTVCRRETAALFWQEAVTALRKGHFLARSNI